MKPGLRSISSAIASRLGVQRLLETVPSKPALILLNFHRIGDSSTSEHDPTVFSTNAEGFEGQLTTLQKRYRFVDADQALAVIQGNREPRESEILVTFDDGYRDGYTQALPVLQKLGIKALFFVVSDYLDGTSQPWWDDVCWLLRKHKGKRLRLSAPYEGDFLIDPDNFDHSARTILKHFKKTDGKHEERFIESLQSAIGSGYETSKIRLMLNWEELISLHSAGMSIGIHTKSHKILSRLDFDEQVEEIADCRDKIIERLGVEPNFLAYPDGSKSSFSEVSKEAVKALGVKAACSFYGGVNSPGGLDPYDVKRLSLDSYASADATRLAFAMVHLRRWA